MGSSPSSRRRAARRRSARSVPVPVPALAGALPQVDGAIGLTSIFELQADDKKDGKGGKKAKTDSKAKPKKK